MSPSRRLVVVIAMISTLLLGAPALADNPFQTEEFEWTFGAGYAECLGEELTVTYRNIVKFREFETPSGNYHYVEHWWWEGEWIGDTTGREWLEHGHSPGVNHVMKQGEIMQWTGKGLAVPVVGDGPKFRYNQRMKYKFDENGELVVFYEPPEMIADWVRCLGPKR